MSEKELKNKAETVKGPEEQPQDKNVHESLEEEASYDGKEAIFPGGPDYDQLQQWKSLHNDEVYITEFGEDVIIFRPIRRREYRDIHNIEGDVNQYYIEEQVCRKSILWPEDYADQRMAFGKAGIPSTLSQIILERSGFLRPAVNRL